MSRCFPFPPPGYEKKIRTDEADSLIKEKHKEKKHKKDKERKEKKDKESSKDKHKERKEKKEKHKERKEKDEEKEKRKASEEKNHVVAVNTLQNNVATDPNNRADRSSKEKTEVISKEKPAFLEGRPRFKEGEHDTVDTRNFRVQDLSRESVKKLTTEGINGKRKDLETNGLLYENGSKPYKKVQGPIASPISSVENGRKLGPCKTPPKSVSELQVTACNLEVREHRTNGFIETQGPKSHPPVLSVKVEENGGTSAKKRPHSDTKYLDQLLNVPKREELHEVGNGEEEEWLFGQSGVILSKKKRGDSSTSLDETVQVWNQALRIESADIVALPYVVPF